MSDIADAVNDTVTDLFGDGTTEDAPDAAEATAPEAEVAPIELPDWEAAGRDLFTDDPEDEPNFEAEADAELTAAEEDLTPSEYDDEQTVQLKKQLLAERKRAEFHQRQHLTTARKTWEADVRSQPWAEFLPPDLATIKATSRRDFNRQVKQIAKANYTVLKPHLDKLAAAHAQLSTVAKKEAEATVQAAWGSPTVSGFQIPQSADQEAGGRLERARSKRSMVEATKAMIDGGLI